MYKVISHHKKLRNRSTTKLAPLLDNFVLNLNILHRVGPKSKAPPAPQQKVDVEVVPVHGDPLLHKNGRANKKYRMDRFHKAKVETGIGGAFLSLKKSKKGVHYTKKAQRKQSRRHARVVVSHEALSTSAVPQGQCSPTREQRQTRKEPCSSHPSNKRSRTFNRGNGNKLGRSVSPRRISPTLVKLLHRLCRCSSSGSSKKSYRERVRRSFLKKRCTYLVDTIDRDILAIHSQLSLDFAGTCEIPISKHLVNNVQLAVRQQHKKRCVPTKKKWGKNDGEEKKGKLRIHKRGKAG